MRKIQYLDGLRGLAALIVVFHHFILAFYPALFLGANAATHLQGGMEANISGSPLNIFYGGNFMVAIFFVLSGFVLSHKFLLRKDVAILTEGAVKRYLRLALPVACSVLLAFVLMKFSLFYNQQAAAVSGSNWLGGLWTFNPNLMDALRQTFIGVFFTNALNYNVTLWTVSFEFFGALLIFSFLALFGNMKNRYWVYLLAAIFFFQTYYLAFILGMLLADLMANENAIVRKFNKSKLLRAGLLLVGLFLGSYPSGRGAGGTIYALMEKDYLTDSAVLYHIWGAFLVILILLNSKRMHKIFSAKILLFLGEISFTMYLLHFAILGSFSSFVFLKLAAHLPYASAFWISFALSCGLLIPVAYLMHIYIDQKIVRFSKSVYLRLFKPE
ncbi:MAG: acyltransferase [Candidatus Moranbacteria bacterium]|nr:acyltransferase [Candidatus Moranbacteria bacterium]